MVDSTLTLNKCSETVQVKAFDFVFVFFVLAQFIIWYFSVLDILDADEGPWAEEW